MLTVTTQGRQLQLEGLCQPRKSASAHNSSLHELGRLSAKQSSSLMGRFEDLLQVLFVSLALVRRFFGLTKPKPSMAYILYLGAASVTVGCPGAEAGAGGGGESPVSPLPPVQTPARHHARVLLGTRR